MRKTTLPQQPALDRQRIIQTALDLIDTQGLAGFSIRQVAKALGVYPTAIYWHVPNLAALQAAVVAHVQHGMMPSPDLASWQDWLKQLLHNFREKVKAHPNTAPLIGAHLSANSEVDLVQVEYILGKLQEAGFVMPALLHAYNTVVAAMTGFTTLEFAAQPEDDMENWQQQLQHRLDTLESGRYPVLASLLPGVQNQGFIFRWDNGKQQPMDTSFDHYTETVILGLEQLLARQSTRPAEEIKA
ncbi:TetR/AcrR family transcriptional regulator [Leeia oryzae]|uniref:TetR/AcrR family transcriptional regulator n=1 Tax=Leeia oryzae TaxID=356662 RepID=UPI00037969CB|nr:TetR/AcrR family transcriptional regulator C-terminal domain-containing protein [Leeia oryzae]